MVNNTLQALFLSLLSYTIASPLAINEAKAIETNALEKRIAENRCEWRGRAGNAGMFMDYTIWMAGWGNNDWSSLSGCGTGLLDNLRADCGLIYNWGCDEIRENPHDTRVHFQIWDPTINQVGDLRCVRDAITRASAGGTVRIRCNQV